MIFGLGASKCAYWRSWVQLLALYYFITILGAKGVTWYFVCIPNSFDVFNIQYKCIYLYTITCMCFSSWIKILLKIVCGAYHHFPSTLSTKVDGRVIVELGQQFERLNMFFQAKGLKWNWPHSLWSICNVTLFYNNNFNLNPKVIRNNNPNVVLYYLCKGPLGKKIIPYLLEV